MTNERKQELLRIMRPPGALTTGFQDFVNRLVAPTDHVAEIGCFAGATSQVLLRRLHPRGALICIDPWKPYKYVEEDMQEVRQCFDQVTAEFSDILTVCTTTSAEAVKLMPDERLDVVYIDGSHDYDDVMFDIREWSRKVKPGGVIAGHDYSDTWKGVMQAVDESFKNQPVRFFEDSTWATIKPLE